MNGNLKIVTPFSSNIYNWANAQVWFESKICKAFPCFQYSHLGQCPKYVPGANSLFPCANIKFLNLEEKLLRIKRKLCCTFHVFSDYNTFRSTRYKVFRNEVIEDTIPTDICNTVNKLEIALAGGR